MKVIHDGTHIPLMPEPKDPHHDIEYGFNYSDEGNSWLDEGEVITSSSWIMPVGITNVEDDFDSTRTKVKVSGGLRKRRYKITNRITTVRPSDGRVRSTDRSLYFDVDNK